MNRILSRIDYYFFRKIINFFRKIINFFRKIINFFLIKCLLLKKSVVTFVVTFVCFFIEALIHYNLGKDEKKFVWPPTKRFV